MDLDDFHSYIVWYYSLEIFLSKLKIKLLFNIEIKNKIEHNLKLFDFCIKLNKNYKMIGEKNVY